MGCTVHGRQGFALSVAVVASATAGQARAGYAPNPIDFATSVVSYDLNNEVLAHYDDPTAVLGAPTTTFDDPYGVTSGNAKGYSNAKIIEAPYWTDHTTGANATVEIPASTATNTYSITVKMGRTVTNNPANPYGVDLIVYGNSFFSGGGAATDSTNLNTYATTRLTAHPLVVSVSPDDVNWYTYPTTSALLPYQAYQWDSANAVSTTNLLNFNQAVNPTVAAGALALSNGYSTAAQILNAYGTAAGGTGFDLSVTGFDAINYVRVSSTTDDYAVVDAIAAVDATPEPGTLGLVALGGAALLGCRRPRGASNTR